jgi:hypothetical protein
MERERNEILDLIVRWEEAKSQGQELSPEALCRQCPDLLTGFPREVAKPRRGRVARRPHRGAFDHVRQWIVADPGP